MQVETAGDCYIAAGGLTMLDEDGFICIDPMPNPVEAAQRVLSFGKVSAGQAPTHLATPTPSSQPAAQRVYICRLSPCAATSPPVPLHRCTSAHSHALN